MRLPGAVIWILPQNHSLDRMIRRQLQRVKDIDHRRINGILRIFACQKLLEALKIFAFKFFFQDIVPIISNQHK